MRIFNVISVFCLWSLLDPGNLTGQDLLSEYNPANQETTAKKEIKRNYIGIDLFETFFDYSMDSKVGLNNLHLSFERISRSGNTSFTAELLLNIEYISSDKSDYYPWDSDYPWEGNWLFLNGLHLSYDPYCYFTKAGFNYYPFNYSLTKTGNFRVFTGVSLLTGIIKRSEYNYEYPYEHFKKVFLASIVMNLDVRWYLTDIIQLKAGIDMSVLPFLVFWSPEIGLSIGF
jgi:hypothetical protein